MTFKEKVYYRILEMVDEKISFLQTTMDDLKETASNETKSTAGDKHETALAMIQIEQENTNRQLKDALSQKQFLERINPSVIASKIANGSLVKTNIGYLFFSIALGKILVDGITVIALSTSSPLGSKLVGSQINDSVELNGTRYVIEKIE